MQITQRWQTFLFSPTFHSRCSRCALGLTSHVVMESGGARQKWQDKNLSSPSINYHKTLTQRGNQRVRRQKVKTDIADPVVAICVWVAASTAGTGTLCLGTAVEHSGVGRPRFLVYSLGGEIQYVLHITPPPLQVPSGTEPRCLRQSR